MKLLSLDCESKSFNAILKRFKRRITISMEWDSDADLYVACRFTFAVVNKGGWRRGDNILISDSWADEPFNWEEIVRFYLFISHSSVL